jgi:hypothetical protein
MSEEGTLEMKVEMRVVRTTQSLVGDFEGGRKSVRDELCWILRSGRWNAENLGGPPGNR